jgi:hypothetical protein
MIMKKHFWVQVEPAEETRFLCDDENLRIVFCAMLESVVQTWTAGPRPAVQVKQEGLECEKELLQAIERVCSSDPYSTFPQARLEVYAAVEELRNCWRTTLKAPPT